LPYLANKRPVLKDGILDREIPRILLKGLKSQKLAHFYMWIEKKAQNH
jgi:hypothetical protein